jgi:peptidyl-tRNA hydrolase, PTH2 family
MKQIIVMRKDLYMPIGKMCAQAAHASMKATLLHMDDPRVRSWLADRFTKVVVSVNNEEELLSVLEQARSNNVIAELITDAGLTVFAGVATNTCIAVGPDSHEALKPITGHLKLL